MTAAHDEVRAILGAAWERSLPPRDNPELCDIWLDCYMRLLAHQLPYVAAQEAHEAMMTIVEVCNRAVPGSVDTTGLEAER